MKAIILTAGYGRRMRPLSDSNHKTLLRVGDTTIIEKILNGLVENDVADIVIVTGYLKDKLESFVLEKFPDVMFTFVHNEIYDKTNNIYSMALAFDQVEIDDDILLIESDLIYHPEIIKAILDDPRDNVALVDNYRQGMDGTVVAVKNNVITNVIPPHLQGHDFDFSDKFKTLNIYKFSQEFASSEFKKLLTYYAQVIDDNCYYELILGILIYMQRQKIYALHCGDLEWVEVDDPNDMNIASFVFDKEKQLDILESSCGGYWSYDITDFCFIRNMYFPTGSILSELKSNVGELLWNYGSRQTILDQKMAYYLLCNVENVVALNGAAQVYPILRNYLEGKSGIFPNPTFGEYYRLFDQSITYDELGDNDITLRSVFDSGSDVIVIVNPNNPTGRAFNSEEVASLAKIYSNKIVIVDESFIEFSEQKSLLPIIEKENISNIIVIKSLSKSLGLPGIRLGYVYSANKDFVRYLRNNVPIWNMNSMAEFFMETLLKNRNAIEQSIVQTIRDREEFASALNRLKFVDKVYRSEANFLLVRLNLSTTEFEDFQKRLLQKNSVYVKNISDKFGDSKSYMRLAVRTPLDNRQLVDILDSV